MSFDYDLIIKWIYPKNDSINTICYRCIFCLDNSGEKDPTESYENFYEIYKIDLDPYESTFAFCVVYNLKRLLYNAFYQLYIHKDVDDEKKLYIKNTFLQDINCFFDCDKNTFMNTKTFSQVHSQICSIKLFASKKENHSEPCYIIYKNDISDGDDADNRYDTMKKNDKFGGYGHSTVYNTESNTIYCKHNDGFFDKKILDEKKIKKILGKVNLIIHTTGEDEILKEEEEDALYTKISNMLMLCDTFNQSDIEKIKSSKNKDEIIALIETKMGCLRGVLNKIKK